MILTLIVFLVILSILVLIHEGGHFFAAKKLGIKVEEFGFGLPPRVFGIKKGETIYSLNLLPIGGFVKLYGEDEEIKSQKFRAFYGRPVWQRALVVVAGVVMNFILAVLVFSFLFTQGMLIPKDRIHIEGVAKDSPAQSAGLKNGDIILKIDDKKITKSADLTSYTKDKLGEKVTLTLERGTVEITPRREYPQNEGPMGIAISNIEMVKYPIYKAPFLGTVEALKMSWVLASGIVILLFQFIFQGIAPQGIAGPVGIAQITGQAVSSGSLAVVLLAGLLSLNLAVVNILPIPAMDGGRLLFILIEMIFRRRVNPHFERYAHTIGLVILLALMALVTFHDIDRLFSGKLPFDF